MPSSPGSFSLIVATLGVAVLLTGESGTGLRDDRDDEGEGTRLAGDIALGAGCMSVR